MGLLDLIEENHRVGTAADLLRQLACLIIAHIAGRRTDQLGDGMLLHILGHIQPDQGVHTVKQIISQPLHQLRLTHTGGTHEDEGNGPLLGGNAHPVAADGPGDSLHGFILTHDMLLQAGS